MQYVIMPAESDDVDAMYDISQITHTSSYYDKLIPASSRKRYDDHYQDTSENRHRFQQEMTERLSDDCWTVLVAKEDDEVLGYTLAQRVSTQSLLLKGLFVRPSAHGQGVGSALFTRSFAHAPTGCVVELVVIADNDIAKALYKKHDFSFVGRAEKHFYGATQEVYRRIIG